MIKYFSATVMLHILLALCLSLQWNQHYFTVEEKNNFLPVYMAPYQEKQLNPIRKQYVKEGIIKTVAASKETPRIAPTQSAQSPAETKSKLASPLLKLLHDRIAANQEYPHDAILLNQSGTVTLKLLLYPDGHLTDISIMQSSGVYILDAAALSAAQSLVRLQEANLYLTKPTYFTVNINFQL